MTFVAHVCVSQAFRSSTRAIAARALLYENYDCYIVRERLVPIHRDHVHVSRLKTSSIRSCVRLLYGRNGEDYHDILILFSSSLRCARVTIGLSPNGLKSNPFFSSLFYLFSRILARERERGGRRENSLNFESFSLFLFFFYLIISRDKITGDFHLRDGVTFSQIGNC